MREEKIIMTGNSDDFLCYLIPFHRELEVSKLGLNGGCTPADAMQQDFQCPAPGELAVTGSFSRHPHYDDCRQYFVCFDGTAREYGCPIGTVFKIGNADGFGQCSDPQEVPGWLVS